MDLLQVDDNQEEKTSQMLQKYVMFWRLTDLDNKMNFAILIVIRLVQACTLTWNFRHAD